MTQSRILYTRETVAPSRLAHCSWHAVQSDTTIMLPGVVCMKTQVQDIMTQNGYYLTTTFCYLGTPYRCHSYNRDQSLLAATSNTKRIQIWSIDSLLGRDVQSGATSGQQDSYVLRVF